MAAPMANMSTKQKADEIRDISDYFPQYLHSLVWEWYSVLRESTDRRVKEGLNDYFVQRTTQSLRWEIVDVKTKVEGFGMFVKVTKLELVFKRTVFTAKIIEIEYLIVLIRKIMYIREEK